MIISTMMRYVVCLLILLPSLLHAKVWYVVQGSAIPDPKTAASLAQSGDTVDIAYAVTPYVAYETKWPQNNLLIRGSGGLPVLKAESFSVTQKAIFVTQGNDITIENIHFTNAKVLDANGAGIRSEGVNLTVRSCTFTYNEDGILAGDKANCTILIEYCVFGFNGHGDGYSHNLYINHVQKFIFQHNYTHDCTVGHLLKSRAYETYILYNRFDSPGGYDPSREIDLPNGGQVVILGNIIRQTVNDQNSNIIGYGLEGLSNPAPQEVYLINNTLINEKSNGSFLQCQSGTTLLKAYNNIVAGGGSFIGGTVPSTLDTASNIRNTNISNIGFIDPSVQNYHLMNTSGAVNNGVVPGLYGTFNLTPSFEYVDDAGTKDRVNHYPIDIGAFETEATTAVPFGIKDDTSKIIVIETKIHFIGIENGTSFILSDLQGKMLIKSFVSESDVLNISTLNTGLYNCVLYNKAGILNNVKVFKL